MNPVRPLPSRPGAHGASALLLPIAMLAAASCSGDGPAGLPPAVASIQVAPGADTLVTLGRVVSFTAVAKDAEGGVITDVSWKWVSSDSLIARVDSVTGQVTAVGNGLATISAATGGVVGAGTVAVIQFVASVTVTPGAPALAAIGATQQFAAVARDSSNAIVDGVRFLWVSSNHAVATIDTTGVATSVGEGEATISATGRGVPAYAELTVTQAATQLAFTVQPAEVRAGSAFGTALQVEVRDASGSLVPSSRIAVTLAFDQAPPGATLFGSRTVNAVGGIATFSGIWMDRPAAEYRLSASADGLASALSTTFLVRPGLPASIQVLPVASEAIEAGHSGNAAAHVVFHDAFGNVADVTLPLTLRAIAPPGVSVTVGHAPPAEIAPGVVRFSDLFLTRPAASLVLEAATVSAAPTLVSRSDPFQVRASYSSISLGADHACAVADGGVFCWGRNFNSELASYVVPAPTADSLPGLAAVSGQPFVQVTARSGSTCALSTSGAVHCWGATPVPGVLPGSGTGNLAFTSISAGGIHACGVNATGAVYCWGNGNAGQLGDGLMTSSETPVKVAGSGTGDLIFSSVDASGTYTCGVTTAGRAYCWGYNGSGELGDSSQVDSGIPVQVAGSGTGDRVFTAISTSTEFGERTCAITDVGHVLCWGSGPLGDGSSGFHTVPTLALAAEGGLTWVDVSTGTDHACAVRSDGQLRCWGYDTHGQFGPNAAFVNLSAVTIEVADRMVLDVEAGHNATCARTTNGTYCWGRNTFGKLGIGATEPVIVRTPTRISQ